MNYQSSEEPRPSAGHFWRNLGWMMSGSALVAVGIGSLWLVRTGDRLFASIHQFFNAPPPAPTVDVRSVMIQQVRNASELTTAVYTMQAVVPASQDMQFGGFTVGTTKLLYIAHGEVRAGVDLSQLSTADITVAGDRVQVMLPPPRILDRKIDVGRSSVYDYNRGALGLGPDVAPDLQTLAQQKALQTVVQGACQDGILQRASDRAKLVVTELLSATSERPITVQTQPPAADACQVTANAPAAAPTPPATAP